MQTGWSNNHVYTQTTYIRIVPQKFKPDKKTSTLKICENHSDLPDFEAFSFWGCFLGKIAFRLLCPRRICVQNIFRCLSFW